MQGRDRTIDEMLNIGSETSQKIANRGSQLIHDLGELAVDLEDLRGILAWDGWQTRSAEPRRHALRGNVDVEVEADRKQKAWERSARLEAPVQRSIAEFDRSIEMLKQCRHAVAALVPK